MPNHLIHENSPYLLQHAHNPVDWYPWGEESLAKAASEDKPIFLSIGYAACHWCHVMAHESFEDPETAVIMNTYFVNIKVDREERPDLDSIYMSAVTAMSSRGGWPMSVFLTPDGQPFYGGTYFPPVHRYNMPSFREVLQSIARLWQEDRPRLLQSAREITQHLQTAQGLPASDQPLNNQVLEEAAMHLAQSYDWENGGWGQAPKFPQPMAIEFLLGRAVHGDKLALDIAQHALNAMAKGGMYDVIGGGFARYSTDDTWLTPHFEKMLYDNAQLARVYLHAYLLTGQASYRRVCEETLDFIQQEMMAPSSAENTSPSGIFSSLDADSEGQEGKFYLWTADEIRAALSASQSTPQEIDFFIAAYAITPGGNLQQSEASHGYTILQRALNDQALSERFHLSIEQVPVLLSDLHHRLLQARTARSRPGTDDKVLVAWNALALTAFAEAARYLQRPDYLEIARNNADFLLTDLYPADRLLRSWRDGKARYNAYLEDYAGLILALLALYQSDPDLWWFSSALQLAEDMLAHYQDPKLGFFDTRHDHDPLLMRPKDLQDNATPSGSALAAAALLQLSIYTDKQEWRTIAETALQSVQHSARQFPLAFSSWLCAIDFALSQVLDIAILGEIDHPATQAMLQVLWSRFRPHMLVAISALPLPPNAPLLLHDRPLLDDQPTAYICQPSACQRPVNTPQEFDELLSYLSDQILH